MKKYSRIVLAFSIFAVLGFITWRAKDVDKFLIEPISRIFWWIYRTLISINQITYWVFLIFAFIFLMVRIFPKTDKYSITPAYKYTYKKNDRVRYWETLMIAAEKSPQDRLWLQHKLQALSQSIEDFSLRKNQGVILLPKCKTGLLRELKKMQYSFQLSLFIHQKSLLPSSELEICIDKIIESMEKQMENKNE